MEKNKKVSTIEAAIDEVSGAIYHCFLLNMSKICTSSNWADINAMPDPTAILIEIKSEKFVEKNNVKNIPRAKPK